MFDPILFLQFATDNFLLAKFLMSKGKFWMIPADPDQPLSKAVDPIIKRSYKRFGVFMDYDCPEGKGYLLEVSPRTYRSNRLYQWYRFPSMTST